MPSQISHREYADAVLNSVGNGAFPQSEKVISGVFPPTALTTILNLIDEARDNVKVSRPCFGTLYFLLLIRSGT